MNYEMLIMTDGDVIAHVEPFLRTNEITQEYYEAAKAKRSSIRFEICKDVQFGARFYDPWHGTWIQFAPNHKLGLVLIWGLQELTNAAHGDIFKVIKGQAKSMTREAYIKKIEELEYLAFEACRDLNEWIQNDCGKSYLYGDLAAVRSIAEYWQWITTNNSKHQEAIGKQYDSLVSSWF